MEEGLIGPPASEPTTPKRTGTMQALLRFTLDLFEAAPVLPVLLPPELATSLGTSPVSVPKMPPAQVIKGQPAIEKIADKVGPSRLLPSPTLQQSLPPASIRHPRATREALLSGLNVAYEFKRGKRRTIGFSVGPEGLAVRAPKWVPLYDIDKAVQEKAAWIVNKLQETRSRQARLDAARIVWQDGAVIPFLGESVTLVIDPRHAFAGIGAELKPLDPIGSVPRLALHVGLSPGADEAQIRDAVQAWLMRQAKRIFSERLDHFAPALGVQWRKLALSSAGTRWGSASADGSIRLNWRLVHFRQPVIDYVVVHELSHLRVMDHSPRFWDTVRRVVPDYAALRGELKDESIPRW